MDRKIRDDEWVRVRSEDELRPGMVVKLIHRINHIITLLAKSPPDKMLCRYHRDRICPRLFSFAPAPASHFRLCVESAVANGTLYRLSDSALGSTDTEATEPAPRQKEGA